MTDAIGTPFSYSSSASSSAGRALEAAGTAPASEKCPLLRDCFQEMEASPFTTDDEKALARIGIALESQSAGTAFNEKARVQALSTVLKACAHPVHGAFGAIIAGVTLESLDALKRGSLLKGCQSLMKGQFKAERMQRDEASCGLLNKSFEIVKYHRGTTPQEAALCDLGARVSPEEAKAAMMGFMTQHLSAHTGTVLAQASLAAEKQCDSFGSVHVLSCGFEAIRDNKSVPATVRAHADKGYHADEEEAIPDPIEQRKAMRPFMKDIVTLARTEEERIHAEGIEELKHMLDEDGGQPAPMEINEQFIEVDGIRLGRKRDPEGNL